MSCGGCLSIWGYYNCNKIPQTPQLINGRNVLITALGLLCQITVPAQVSPGLHPSLGNRWLVSQCVLIEHEERWLTLCGPFPKNTAPTHADPSVTYTITSPRLLLLMPSHCRVGFQHLNGGWSTNSLSIVVFHHTHVRLADSSPYTSSDSFLV